MSKLLNYFQNDMKYTSNNNQSNNKPLSEHFYSGSHQSTLSDDYQYNDVSRDYFKLPGFHQTFGSTEIARFSHHDEIFEQIQNQLLSSSITTEPSPSTSSGPLSSLINHQNNVLSESHNQNVSLQQTLPSAKKPKAKTQRRTKSTSSKSSKTSSSSNSNNDNYNFTNYKSSMDHNRSPSHVMPEPPSKYWNNQMSSYYDRPYIPNPNPMYPYHRHMNHNYSPPSSLHDHSTMCNNYECRYHHSTSYPYNSYQNSYYENPYYSSQQYQYSHNNYHLNYWGYNCQTV